MNQADGYFREGSCPGVTAQVQQMSSVPHTGVPQVPQLPQAPQVPQAYRPTGLQAYRIFWMRALIGYARHCHARGALLQKIPFFINYWSITPQKYTSIFSGDFRCCTTRAATKIAISNIMPLSILYLNNTPRFFGIYKPHLFITNIQQ